MFALGTGRSLVPGGNRGVGSKGRLVGECRGGFVCCVGVSGLSFCQTWQCSRGRIGHRWRQGSEDRAGGGHGRFWRLVAGLASR